MLNHISSYQISWKIKLFPLTSKLVFFFLLRRRCSAMLQNELRKQVDLWSVACKGTFQTPQRSLFTGWENFNLQGFSPFFHYVLGYFSFHLCLSVLNCLCWNFKNEGSSMNFKNDGYRRGPVHTLFCFTSAGLSIVVDSRVIVV